jgi:hypothetical protein
MSAYDHRPITTEDRRQALFKALAEVKGNNLQWLIALMSIKYSNLFSLLLPESYRFNSLKLLRKGSRNVMSILSYYGSDGFPLVVFGGGATPIAAFSNVNSKLAKGQSQDDEYNTEYAPPEVHKLLSDPQTYYTWLLDTYRDSFHRFPSDDTANED